MMNLSVNIGGLKLRNPIMNASGTFGLSDYSRYIDFSKIGALVAKSITLNPRRGNKPPRIAEVQSGIINSVGIQNDGTMDFVKNKLPEMKKFDVPLIVSVSNLSVSDYKASVEILEKEDGIAAYEINVSCPNLKMGGKAFGMSADDTYNVTGYVKDVTAKPVIVKLSPNVTDIVEIAKAACEAGADALTVANTYTAMAVNLKIKKPMLSNVTGGLSGAAIKPITMRLVYEIKKSLDIPVIACGGVYNAQDALEYLMLGASAVQVGTANFRKPDIMIDIIDGIKDYMIKENINDINDFIGSIKF